MWLKSKQARRTTEAVTEIGKRSVIMKPLTEFVKMIGPYMYPDENEGIDTLTISEYDKANSGEASGAISSGYMTFCGTPGYRYSLKLATSSSIVMKRMASV